MGEDLEVDNIYEAPKRNILKACVKCQPTLTRQMLHISDYIYDIICRNLQRKDPYVKKKIMYIVVGMYNKYTSHKERN